MAFKFHNGAYNVNTLLSTPWISEVICTTLKSKKKKLNVVVKQICSY